MLILAALAWLVPRLLDQQRWLAWLEQEASLVTGRTVTIGKISVYLLPRPGLEAAHVTLANPSWTGRPYLAQIDHISAQLLIASLWHRRFEIAKLHADGIQLDLETDATHPGNWLIE